MKPLNNPAAVTVTAAMAALLVSSCSAEADAGPTALATDAESATATVEEPNQDELYGLSDEDIEPSDDDDEPLTDEHLADGVEMPDCVAARNDIYVTPGTTINEDDLASMCPENEILIECSDPEALAANANHEPAGWPAHWEEGEPLPDPECHADFIEIYTWDRFADFHTCWVGPETSTMVRTPSMSDQDVYANEWKRSNLRAEWEAPEGWVLPDGWEVPDDMDQMEGWDPGDNSQVCAQVWEENSPGI